MHLQNKSTFQIRKFCYIFKKDYFGGALSQGQEKCMLRDDKEKVVLTFVFNYTRLYFSKQCICASLKYKLCTG